MTKNTVTISAQGAASAGGKAALSGADILQAAQYDAHGRAGLPTLRSAFPQYRELAEVLQEIAASPEMTGAFRSLTPSRRQEFLDFCCGNRGVRVLYDSYFKYVFDPDVEAAALSRMISVLIGLDVKLVQILPNESHLGADYTLVIMDIIVEASDGSIVNVEVQKIGYNFPGERAACYNADLLLRQYHIQLQIHPTGIYHRIYGDLHKGIPQVPAGLRPYLRPCFRYRPEAESPAELHFRPP